MYLVLLRHTMDDLPVRLCATREEALAVANEMPWEPSTLARKIFRTGCSSPCAIAIVQFTKAGGYPMTLETVRSIDEEQPCPSNK